MEYAGTARCASISNGRRAKRMLHRKGLKQNVVNTKRGRVARLTLDPAEESPSGGAKSAPWHRLDIAHRSSGLNPVYPAKPVCAAVNHHSMAAIGDLQRGVHTVQPTFDVDFAARSQELQFHS